MADYIKASDLALLTEGYELTMADGFMGAGADLLRARALFQ